jgi:hypothetical protein
MQRGKDVDYCPVTFRQLWARGDSYQEIAVALGCSQSYISKLKVRHSLPDRPRSNRDILADDPTPEQIAERAAECRARRPDPATPRGDRVSIVRYTWTGKGFQPLT